MNFLGAKILALLAAAPAWMIAPKAQAATVGTKRTVYFNATGTNRTQDGLSQQAQSTCKITLANPSSYSQNYAVTVQASSVNGFATGAVVTATAPGSTSGTLAASGTATLTWTYTAFPIRSASGANTYQQLRCAGSIEVSDVNTAGFIIASGTLTTFVESARMQTDGTTGGTATFGGIAVYTQVPIAINRGKPF